MNRLIKVNLLNSLKAQSVEFNVPHSRQTMKAINCVTWQLVIGGIWIITIENSINWFRVEFEHQYMGEKMRVFNYKEKMNGMCFFYFFYK
jgi:hypothetical protein